MALMSSVVSLALSLVLCCSINVATCTEYYIIPKEGDLSGHYKENHQCLTLSQFTENHHSQHFDVRTVLNFVPGTHFLKSDLNIMSVNRFEMISLSLNSRTTIICEKSSRLAWNSTSHVSISYLEFSKCGLNIADSVDHFEIANSAFIGSAGSGSALWISHSNVTITKTFFISNTVGSSHGPTSNDHTTDTVYVGGAIFATRESNVSISESKFVGNGAQHGGAIFVELGSRITIHHSALNGTGSRNVTSGAALYAEIGCSVTIDNTTISDTSALDNGGSVFLHNSSLTAYRCVFLNNSAPVGGGVFAYQSTINFSKCQFNSNVAGYLQSVFNENTDTTQTTNGSNSTNTVGGYGGALYVEWSNLSIDLSVFLSNRAYKDGGAIRAYNGSVQLHRSNFSYNTANQFGGAVSARSSNLLVNDTLLSYNTADNIGGAVHVVGRDTPQAENNTATYDDKDELVTFTIKDSTFRNNSANYAGALYSYKATLTISRSNFTANSAVENGGALMLEQGMATVQVCNFTHNKAHNGGGIYSRENCTVIVDNSMFTFNYVTNDAGCLSGDHNMVTIRASIFRNNMAKWAGAVAAYVEATVTIHNCTFKHNKAKFGGALALHMGKLIVKRSIIMHQDGMKEGGVAYAHLGVLIIESSLISYNRARKDGGALTGVDAELRVHRTNFSHNEARYYGSVVHWTKGTINVYGDLLFEFNTAQRGVMYLYDTTAQCTGNATFLHNHGSLFTFNSDITFTGSTIFKNCSSIPVPTRTARGVTTEISKLEGGAVTATFGSTVTFRGQCILINNHAKVGGGFLITESKIYLNGDSLMANNVAMDRGGGVYLYQSELNCKTDCRLQILNNIAANKGGGVHAFSSLIKVTDPSSTIHFIENKAEMGGGICLEMNTKIYVLKTNATSSNAISFIANEASTNGGAIHVVDGGHSCRSMNTLPYVTDECFLQVIEQYDIQPSYLSADVFLHNYTSCDISVYFSNNTAKSGSNIYGGLINSCTINAAHNPRYSGSDYSPNTIAIVNGTSYISKISNTDLESISSEPIQICFCRDGWPDCSYQPCPIKIMKGGSFTVSLAAVDQANQPITGVVHSSFKSAENNLTKHILTVNQDQKGSCTNLLFYNAAPGNSSDKLILHVEGPCKDTELSKRRIEIEFYSCSMCPVGFEPLTKSTRCECTCDSTLEPYVTKCNSSTGVLLRESNFWLAYFNDTELVGYLLYPFCPLDYCYPSSANVELNLNIQNGSDAQCAFNRTGLLCGRCQPGLSLSLGSSQCLSCRDNWPILFAAITLTGLLAGIGLTVVILVLNLTVAVGTVNGVLFYANILAASRSTFLPLRRPNFAAGLISLLNLELGFDTCYLEGMDAYIKTWLQLVFPLYMFVLVVVIIKLSQCSSQFSNVIGKKNPVATLSTLILLSYSNILQTAISALSFATLDYPDGSHKRVWRHDASVEYLNGKHIALFVTATVILLLGFVYTTLLFSWQWLLQIRHCGMILKWTRNTKLIFLMETYHAPYSTKRRYWTGLLLIVRAVLYLVMATNVSGNPRVTLVSTVFAMSFILLWKASVGLRIYKNWVIDTLETFLYFNVLTLATFTWFTLETDIQQTATVYVSTTITFVVLVMVVCYHAYKFTREICSRKAKKIPEIQHRALELDEYRPRDERVSARHCGPQDTDRFQDILELFDSEADEGQYLHAAGSVGYQMTRKHDPLSKKPTHSVVEFPKPEPLLHFQLETDTIIAEQGGTSKL